VQVVPATTLVGRDPALSQLQTALHRARAGAAAVVLLRGEPGMGKSRLLQAVADMARDAGAAMLEANAYESETVRPFALWIDALRKWSSGAASNVFQASNRGNREHLFDALSGLVGQVSADADLAVLFDDLQWCDESSASALHYVVRTNRERRLLVVLCARESELRDNAAAQQALRGLAREGLLEEIVLGPLPAVAIRALIESCAPKVDSGRLSEQCAGNPLLAIELARAEAAGEAGASLRELIRERLAHLDVDSAEVLRWASVLAPNIDLTAWPGRRAWTRIGWGSPRSGRNARPSCCRPSAACVFPTIWWDAPSTPRSRPRGAA
jgi:predicted ATPase